MQRALVNPGKAKKNSEAAETEFLGYGGDVWQSLKAIDQFHERPAEAAGICGGK